MGKNLEVDHFPYLRVNGKFDYIRSFVITLATISHRRTFRWVSSVGNTQQSTCQIVSYKPMPPPLTIHQLNFEP
jgi:hypothetical protein